MINKYSAGNIRFLQLSINIAGTCSGRIDESPAHVGLHIPGVRRKLVELKFDGGGRLVGAKKLVEPF
jgi:hypothetical protein